MAVFISIFIKKKKNITKVTGDPANVAIEIISQILVSDGICIICRMLSLIITFLPY